MAQKSVGVDVLPGLYSWGRGHSRQPVCATQAGESRVHPHPDAGREGVLRYDADRDGGAGSSVRKEETRARLAELVARNENDLELDRTAEACLDVKLTTADQRRGGPRSGFNCVYGNWRLQQRMNQYNADDAEAADHR